MKKVAAVLVLLVVMVGVGGCSRSKETSTVSPQSNETRQQLETANARVAALEIELATIKKRLESAESELRSEKDRASKAVSQLSPMREELNYYSAMYTMLREKVVKLGDPFIGVKFPTGILDPVPKSLKVAVVTRGSPAQQAGILVGSVITHIDSVQVLTYSEFEAALAKHIPTDNITVTFTYNGQARTVNLTLGVKPRYET